MARKRRSQRPFRPETLEGCASPELAPRMTPSARAWRFTVVVPVEEIKPTKRLKATAQDLNELQRLLLRHFRGLTVLPATPGYGLRDPRRPAQEPEMNMTLAYVVYAAPVPESEQYFRALQQELQTALDEGVILVERQEVLLL